MEITLKIVNSSKEAYRLNTEQMEILNNSDVTNITVYVTKKIMDQINNPVNGDSREEFLAKILNGEFEPS